MSYAVSARFALIAHVDMCLIYIAYLQQSIFLFSSTMGFTYASEIKLAQQSSTLLCLQLHFAECM